MANLFQNSQWLDLSPVDGIPDKYELWYSERMTFNLAANDLYLPSGGNKIIVEAPSDKLLCGLQSPWEEGGGENWLDVAHHTFYDVSLHFDLIHGHFTFSFELCHNGYYQSYYNATFMDNTHYWWQEEDYYTGIHKSLKTCPSGHFTERIYTQVRYWEDILGPINKLVAYWIADFDPVTHLGEDSHFEAANPVLTLSKSENQAFII